MTIRKLVLSLAGLAIGAMLSLAPALAQHHSCGGSAGEGCWTPRQQQQQQRQWGLPEWKPQQRYGAPVLQPRRHGNVAQQRGHNRAVAGNRSRGTTTTASSFRNVTLTKTGSFRVLTGQTIQQCVRSRITGEIRC